MLSAAQLAVQRGDFQTAVDAFSDILRKYNDINVDAEGKTKPQSLSNVSLVLLSRSQCYMHLQNYISATIDLKAVVSNHPNLHHTQELAPGCYSTHSAALSRLALCAVKQGDKELANGYKRKATEQLKRDAEDREYC